MQTIEKSVYSERFLLTIPIECVIIRYNEKRGYYD